MNGMPAYILKNWKHGVLPIIYLLASSIISLVYPQISRLAIDIVVTGHDYQYLSILSIGFMLLIVSQRLLSYLNEVHFFRFQKETILRIQGDLLKKVFGYPLEYFDERHSGYLLGRIRGDVAGLSYVFSEGIVEIVLDMIKMIIALIILLSMNYKLAIISILFVPLLILKILTSQKAIHSVNEHILEENARLDRELSDTFQGIEVIKSFSKEEEGLNRSIKSLKDYQNREIERNVVFARYRNIVGTLFHIGEVLLLYYGIKEIVFNKLTIGEYFAFSGYLLILYAPLRNLSFFSMYLDYASKSYNRIKELTDMMPEDNGTIDIDRIDEIEIQGLVFKYENSKKLFRDVNVTIKKCDKILIKGESGSGKSTLIKLLLGLYRIQEGQIKYNGIDIRQLSKKTLRGRIGYVSQSIFLFNKSLKENLLLGNKNVCDESVRKLMAECGVKGSNILDMPIAERGKNLSGGEKQRIALVRAILKDPDVIILDEATANLDVDAERDIEVLVNRMFSDKIIIKITHRPERSSGWKILELRAESTASA